MASKTEKGAELRYVIVTDLPTAFTSRIIATQHDLQGKDAPQSVGVDFLRAYVGYNSMQGISGDTYFIGDPGNTAFTHFSYLSYPASTAAAIRSREGTQEHLLHGFLKTLQEMSPPLQSDVFREPLIDLGTPRLLPVAIRHLLHDLPRDEAVTRDIIIMPDHVMATYPNPGIACAIRDLAQPEGVAQHPYHIDIPWLTDTLLAEPMMPANHQAAHLTELNGDGMIEVLPAILPGMTPITHQALYVSRSAALICDIMLAATDTGDQDKVRYTLPGNTTFRSTGRGGFAMQNLVGRITETTRKAPEHRIDVFYLTIEAVEDDPYADRIVTPSIASFDPKETRLPEFIHLPPFTISSYSLANQDDFNTEIVRQLGEIQEHDPVIWHRIERAVDFDPQRVYMVIFDSRNLRISAAALAQSIPGCANLFHELNWPLNAAQTHRGALKYALMSAQIDSETPVTVPDNLARIETDRRFRYGGETMSASGDEDVGKAEAPTPEDGADTAADGVEAGIAPDAMTPSPKPISAAIEKAVADRAADKNDQPDGDTEPKDDEDETEDGGKDGEVIGGENDPVDPVTEDETGAEDGEAEAASVESRAKDAATADTEHATGEGVNDAADQDDDQAAARQVTFREDDPELQDAEPGEIEAARRLSVPVRWVRVCGEWQAEVVSRNTTLSGEVRAVLEDEDGPMLDHLIAGLRLAQTEADADADEIKAKLPDQHSAIKAARQIEDGSYNPADWNLPAGPGTKDGEKTAVPDAQSIAAENGDDGALAAPEPEAVTDGPDGDLAASAVAIETRPDDAAENGTEDAAQNETDIAAQNGDDEGGEDAGEADATEGPQTESVSKDDPEQAPDTLAGGNNDPGKAADTVEDGGARLIIQNDQARDLLQAVKDNRGRGRFSEVAGVAQSIVTLAQPTEDGDEADNDDLAALQRHFLNRAAGIVAPSRALTTLDHRLYSEWFAELTRSWVDFVKQAEDGRIEIAERVFGLTRVIVPMALNFQSGAQRKRFRADFIETVKKNGLGNTDWQNLLDVLMRETGISLDMLDAGRDRVTFPSETLLNDWQRAIRGQLTPRHDLADKTRREADLDHRVSLVMSILIKTMRDARADPDAVIELGKNIPFDKLPPAFGKMTLTDLAKLLRGRDGEDETDQDDGGEDGENVGGNLTPKTGDTTPQPSAGRAEPPQQPRYNLDRADYEAAKKWFAREAPAYWQQYGIEGPPAAHEQQLSDSKSKAAFIRQFGHMGVSNHNAAKIGITTVGYWLENLRNQKLYLDDGIFEVSLRYALAHITENGDLLRQNLTVTAAPVAPDAEAKD